MKLYHYVRILVLVVALAACGGDRTTDTSDVLPVPPDTSTKVYDESVRLYDAVYLEDFRKNSITHTNSFISAEGIESLEILLRRGSIDPAEELKDDGFVASFDELILVSVSTENQTENVVQLHISKDGIHDSKGNILIDQIEAEHGYGWRLTKTTGSEVVPARSYLVIIMLDENGKANSDELFIYRSYESGKLGEFIVTNLPDELL